MGDLIIKKLGRFNYGDEMDIDAILTQLNVLRDTYARVGYL
jgi:hypothetical protein